MAQRTVRAILIDSIEKKVSEIRVEDDPKNIKVFCKSIKEFLGCERMWVAQNPFDTKHFIYVDDEGLLHNPQGMFQILKTQPLANKAVIVLEHDSREWHIDAKLTVEEVESSVQWIPEIMIPIVINQLLGTIKIEPWVTVPV